MKPIKIKTICLLMPLVALTSCGLGTDLVAKEHTCNPISKLVSTNEVSGTIHNIEGDGSYFKWNGALFKIITNEGYFNINRTSIYKDDQSIEFDSSLLTEGIECKGRIGYGLANECNDNIDLIEVPYLSSLYLGKHENSNGSRESKQIYFLNIKGNVKAISSEEIYFDYEGIYFSIGIYTSISLNKESISFSKLTSYTDLDKSNAIGRVGFSNSSLLDKETNVFTPYLSSLSIDYQK